MEMARQLGIELSELLFIEKMVNLFRGDTLPELSIKMKHHIDTVHTGHYIYLGICVGSTIEAYSNSIKNNQINLSCRKN